MSTTSSAGASLHGSIVPTRRQRRHRAHHFKSRNGCYTCKGRRVKCDEVRPTCGSCSSRGDACTYPPPATSMYV
ncbi:hypothetical protein DPV78_004256 [Talaromyces pinophilus]|nr:hypothetical protein DPV78_004256 [Talaromyces pinophilus]